MKYKLLGIALMTWLIQACTGGDSATSGAGGTNNGSGTNGGGSTIGLVRLSGAVATGMALPGAVVEIKCAQGSATAITSSGGLYSKDIADASLPCLLSATSSDGVTVLYGLAQGTGPGTAVANISPLTQITFAQAAGAHPGSVFLAFNAAQTATVNGYNISAALTVVSQVLSGVVTLGTLNPLTDTLTPATTSNPTSGNAHDKMIDAVTQALSFAQNSLFELTQSFANNTGGVGGASGNLLVSKLTADYTQGNYEFSAYANNTPGIFGDRYFINKSKVTSSANNIYNISGIAYLTLHHLNTAVWNDWNIDYGYTYNAIYNSGLRPAYFKTNGAWQMNTTLSTGYILPSTLKQTSNNTYTSTPLYGAAQNYLITSTTPSTFDLASLMNSVTVGNIGLPSGATVFTTQKTYLEDDYTAYFLEDNNFNNLDDFINDKINSPNNYSSGLEPTFWQRSNNRLSWAFDTGVTQGVLNLKLWNRYTGVIQNTATGTWERKTVNGIDLILLNLPQNLTMLPYTGQKYFYTVVPIDLDGTMLRGVRLGVYTPAGATSVETTFNATAAQAISTGIGIGGTP